MNLRNTCAGSSFPLHQPHAILSCEAHPKDFLDALAKVLLYNGLDILPVVLRRIIEHAAKHLLELRRKNSALHRNGLPNLEVQPAIGAEEVEKSLGITVV